MARGDQIYVMRPLMGMDGIYEHHGIDCGDGTVIHYHKGNDAVITRTSYALFARGNPVYTKSYATSYVPDVVITRAESRLGERLYNLFTNNCEHFATWCKVGRNESLQLADY
ncbi:MAG TPA: lecithin retinol acyltransferase family protein, partial [Allocoleopsis sp.]